MLEHLHIKNVALILESEIDFERGLNILSGETGAGKSMIIDSLNFALGERTSANFLRKGEKNAIVEALFSNRDSNIIKKLEENGIPSEEDGSLLLTRTLNRSGKSICRINGSMVTVGMMKEIAEGLMDIHGQHAHQSLLNPARHIQLLDRFCGKELEEVKEEYQAVYKAMKELEKELEALLGDEKARARRLDLLQFQIEEIGQAQLKVGEEEELTERRQKLANSEKIRQLTENSLRLLYGGTEVSLAAIDQLSRALEDVADLANYDSGLENLYETLSSAYAQMDDAIRDLQRYGDTIGAEPEELEQVEERLQLIYRLKRKYGGSIEEILTFYQKAEEERIRLENSEEIVRKLETERRKKEEKALLLAENMTKIRKEKAKKIEKEIEQQLWDLEMKQGRFSIAMGEKKEVTAQGKDKVEFLISANVGEELKPLSKIASGGEMSRVMLALKTVLAKVDHIDAFIFDEIDTGVSGRTAQKVAEKMAVIGGDHQIICITHLPQIAAMADYHFLIEKRAEGEQTITSIRELEEKASVAEIARLIGGAKMTDVTRKAAKELKRQAEDWKKESRKK